MGSTVAIIMFLQNSLSSLCGFSTLITVSSWSASTRVLANTTSCSYVKSKVGSTIPSLLSVSFKALELTSFTGTMASLAAGIIMVLFTAI